MFFSYKNNRIYHLLNADFRVSLKGGVSWGFLPVSVRGLLCWFLFRPFIHIFFKGMRDDPFQTQAVGL